MGAVPASRAPAADRRLSPTSRPHGTTHDDHPAPDDTAACATTQQTRRVTSAPLAGAAPDFGLHHVQLAVPACSEDACRTFYVGVLGLTEVAKPPALAARGGSWVRAGALELHLGVEDDFRPARKAHPGILVRDVDALVDRLTTAGVEVRWDGDFPGHRRCYADDPVGNRLEFLQPEPGLPA